MITLDGETLSLSQLYQIACSYEEVDVASKCWDKIAKTRKVLEKCVEENKPVYGATTSFGEMAHHLIPKTYEQELQLNLVRSHASNAGKPLEVEEVRAIMVARANCLARGYSGIRPEPLKILIDFLNKKIHPVIPERGTVGASGDLGPLSHMALALIGEGECYTPLSPQPIPASRALKHYNLNKLSLSFKEGLALINGTSASCGIASLNVEEARRLTKMALEIAALSLQALDANTKAFDPKGQKPHPGQIDSASALTKLLQDSGLVEVPHLWTKRLQAKYRHNKVVDVEEHIQDAYSLRCTPQIVGAVIDTLHFASEVVQRELNSSNDNPLFFEDGDVFHGGNFHGQHIGFAMDYLSVALTQLGNLSERRLNRLLDKNLNKGLPEFLISDTPGLNLGFEGLQYLAVEACAENRTLSAPASIHSIPCNEENQDVVPMSFWAARKCRRILRNLEVIMACELMAACQALDFRDPAKLSPGTRELYVTLRKAVSKLVKDRPLYKDVEKTINIIRSREAKI